MRVNKYQNPENWQSIKRCIKICLLLSVFCLLLSSYCAPANLKIHFLDVGEGDSVFIETPGGKTVLIDAGNLITGLNVVRYLEKNNIYELDHFVFTHPHLDHIGGVFFVLPMIGAGNIYDNGENLNKIIESQNIYRWYGDLVRKSNKYSALKAGDSLFLGEVELEILWPDKPFAFYDFNVNSLVIMVKYKDFRCLLVGDLTIPAEVELLKKKSLLRADILKVGHHGSSDASSSDFLKAVSPKIAIISVDKDNFRGYPSLKVLTGLEEVEAKIYRTDKNEDIVVQVEDDGKIVVKAAE